MGQRSHTPLLSICIPTYNRAELLRLALQSLISQVRELNDEVELIISDNCSPDHTQEVVQWAQQQIPILYHRNDENIGAARNMLVLTNELAKGDFCWIIGDDDMVLKGKLPKLLNVIRAHPDLDYFFVNYFVKALQERNRLILEMDSFYVPDKGECMFPDFSERRLAKWEDLLNIELAEAKYAIHIYLYIGSHVFRRSMWCTNAHVVHIKRGKDLADFDTTFPHVKILGHAMAGRPAYYVGDPIILLGSGGQEWVQAGVMGAMLLANLPDAFRLYRSLGVEDATIRRLQLTLLDEYYYTVLWLISSTDSPGRQYFSLRKFLWAYRKYPRKTARLLALVVLMWIFMRMPKPIQKALRIALKHKLVIRISRCIIPLRMRRVVGDILWWLWAPPAEKKDGGV